MATAWLLPKVIHQADAVALFLKLLGSSLGCHVRAPVRFWCFVAEAIEAAELAAAETRYRFHMAREMYGAGRRDAQAEMAETWCRAAAPVAHRDMRCRVGGASLETWRPRSLRRPAPGWLPGPPRTSRTERSWRYDAI
jgi:hypothetical protein